MVIQSHLKKLFAGIHSVEFDDEHGRILAMKSLEGEVVPLKKPVTISSDVEVSIGGIGNKQSQVHVEGKGERGGKRNSRCHNGGIEGEGGRG